MVRQINERLSAEIKKARSQSFHHHGAKLFNGLPKYLRNATGLSIDEFKELLDCHLSKIQDEPKIRGTTNGLDHKI